MDVPFGSFFTFCNKHLKNVYISSEEWLSLIKLEVI